MTELKYFDSFKNEVLTGLTALGYEVCEGASKMAKSNQKPFFVSLPGEGMSEKIMLCESHFYMLYDKHKNGMSISDILQSLVSYFKDAAMLYAGTIASGIDEKNFSRYVYFQLVNTERNKELLERVPHRSFLDMSVIYRLRPKENVSFIFTNSLIEKYNTTEEQLFVMAKENTITNLPPIIEAISPDMLAVTNKSAYCGAVALLFPEVLKDAAKLLGSDLYIIPASVNDIILMPASEDIDYMRDTIKEANDTVLYFDEILSYNLYKYDRKTASIRIFRKGERNEKFK